LFGHFAKKKDTENLERVVQKAVDRKHDAKEMLDRLFQYYNKQNDYDKAKTFLLKAFQFVHHDYYKEYQKIKKFLQPADWEALEAKLFKHIKEKNLSDYLKICLDKGSKDVVLQTILQPPQKHGGFFIFVDRTDFDQFADKLKEDYPKEIIEYYWKRAYGNIPNGTRKTYRTAAHYLKKVKEIYVTILEAEEQ
jgi:hypothetical protein